MHRLVRGVGVFLGLVIVCLAFLRAVQLENMLPLDSDDVGYINFGLIPKICVFCRACRGGLVACPAFADV